MRIAFLGDSLTEGRPGAAFLPLLERLVREHHLLNMGRAGDGVSDLLRRLARQDPGPLDLAFVWIGVNDAVAAAWDAPEAPAARAREARLSRIAADYARVLEWAAERAPAVVCVRPIVLEAEGSVWAAYACELGDAEEACARRLSTARTLDLRPAFAEAARAGRGPYTLDGVHFTDAGAAVVADAFAREIAVAGG